MSARRSIACGVSVLAVALFVLGPRLASAQFMRDPLTAAEADQVRSTAGRLDKRVPLLLQFAAERLARFHQVRTASPPVADRDSTMYSLLRQYAEIMPELDDAVDDLASDLVSSQSHHYSKKDITKVLAAADLTIDGFQNTLHDIQKQSSPADLATYHFELDNCLDVTSDSLQNVQDELKQVAHPAANHQ